MERTDITRALRPVIHTLEQLGVAYYIGGSVASSAYGVARSTLDVDLVADLTLQHVDPLVEFLAGDYYIARSMVADAIRRGASFSMIHLETMIKVDVFVINTLHQREAIRRRREERLTEDEGFYLCSAEDIILHKLEWFRMGGEVSERQWNDVLGILRVQGNTLDTEYLCAWATRLGVEDLLTRAMEEAMLPL